MNCPEHGAKRAQGSPDCPNPTGRSIAKKEYLSKVAPNNVQIKSLWIWLCYLLSLILFVLSFQIPSLLPFRDVFVVSAYNKTPTEEPDDQASYRERILWTMDQALEVTQRLPEDEDADTVARITGKVEKLKEHPSLTNLSNLHKTLKKYGAEYPDKETAWMLTKGNRAGGGFLMLIIIGLIPSAMLFLLTALYKSAPLSVCATVLMLIAQIPIGVGWIMLLTLILGIVQTVLCIQIHKAYKAYRHDEVNAVGTEPVTCAPAVDRKKGAVAFVCLLLSMVLLLVSLVWPLVSPINVHHPFYRYFEGNAEDSVALSEALNSSYRATKESVEGRKDEMSAEEKKATETILNMQEKVIHNCSVMNVHSLCRTVNKYGSDYMDSGSLEMAKEFSIRTTTVIFVMFVFFLLPVIFALLGGLKKKLSFLICAAILSVYPQLLFIGGWMAILTMVVFITEIIICIRLKDR